MITILKMLSVTDDQIMVIHHLLPSGHHIYF